VILKIEVQTPLGRIAGVALPLNVADGAVADEVGRAEPLKVIVVGPSSVIIEVRVLVL
jgi:hypothetical protein